VEDTTRWLHHFPSVMKTSQGNVFNISSKETFSEVALKVFKYQAVHTPVYSQWLDELGLDYRKIERAEEIPFLPISLFRDHKLISKEFNPDLVFESSGTTGMRRSRHFIADRGIYERSFRTCFRIFYGEITDYIILALLPSYMDRKGSSLVYMAQDLIKSSESELSGFFLDDLDLLRSRITGIRNDGRKILLLGVSFALLDLAENGNIDMNGHIVMETGGMKGRRDEITREELHSFLCKSFNLDKIHSEYGMTELLSQAYSMGDGIFRTPPWMKVLVRDPHDPFSILDHGRTGGVNIIDLANIYSCSFIETSDLGVSHPDGSFEILGRFDNSDIRGCNLLI